MLEQDSTKIYYKYYFPEERAYASADLLKGIGPN